VLPVLNGCDTVQDAVESVLRQTFDDFELIVIDDGSTDCTAELLARISDARVRVVRHHENRGIVKALNEGIALARADLVARMDADDRCAPTRFDLQIKVLDAHPDVGLVATACRKIDRDGRVVSGGVTPASHAAIWLRLLFGNCISHASVMFRKAIVERVGRYDPEWYPAEDYALWLDLAAVTRLVAIEEPLIDYQVGGEGISSRNEDAQRERAIARSVRALVDVLHCDVDRDAVAAVMVGSGTRPVARVPSRPAVELILAAAEAVDSSCRARGIPTREMDEQTVHLLLRESVLGRGAARAREIVRVARERPATVPHFARRLVR
jgi:glycosyltransferase involved in cell wall biosynthesis